MRNLSIVKKKFFDYADHIIKNNKISHAYIIELEDYETDMIDVYDFIKMILLEKTHSELESVSDNIIKFIDNNSYSDIKVIEPEGNNIRKKQLLDLQREYSNKSLSGSKRIYVIKNAEKMNQASGNTLLKFLEEPEDDIVALLLTNNRYNIIETIISRCQILSLKEADILDDEEEKLLEFLEFVVNPKKFFIKYNYFINNYISDKNIAKEKFNSIEKTIIEYLNNQYFGDSFNEKINSILDKVDEKKLLFYISIIEQELLKLEYNVNYKLWIDSLFSKLIVGGKKYD